MAKYYGRIGFIVTEESPEGSGVYVENRVERYYYGDVTKNYSRWEHGSKVNSDVNVSNVISVVLDPFATLNAHNIRYIEWMNAFWNVTNIEVQYPRMTISFGGVYNGYPTGITHETQNSDA